MGDGWGALYASLCWQELRQSWRYTHVIFLEDDVSADAARGTPSLSADDLRSFEDLLLRPGSITEEDASDFSFRITAMDGAFPSLPDGRGWRLGSTRVADPPLPYIFPSRCRVLAVLPTLATHMNATEDGRKVC